MRDHHSNWNKREPSAKILSHLEQVITIIINRRTIKAIFIYCDANTHYLRHERY